jgi:hypothetical protein
LINIKEVNWLKLINTKEANYLKLIFTNKIKYRIIINNNIVLINIIKKEVSMVRKNKIIIIKPRREKKEKERE